MRIKIIIPLILVSLVMSNDMKAQKREKQNTLSTNVLYDALGFYNAIIGRSIKDGRQEVQFSVGLAFPNEESDAWLAGDSNYYFNMDGIQGGFIGLRHYLFRKKKGLFVQGQLKLINFSWLYRADYATVWTESNALFVNPSAHAGYKLCIFRTGLYLAGFAGIEFQGGEWISEEGITLRDNTGEKLIGGGIVPEFGFLVGYNF